ncbi:MAG: hypothetical protein JW896_02470 [Deltaproteobacteria bacterium]|nr:hypothetical protein [Deltaproteobacteria bacterium]
MKSLFIVYLLIMGLAFLGCTSTRPVGGLNNLSDEDIEAYNSNPNNTDKIVCRNEPQIGTRVPKRVCRKESEIIRRARQDQRTLERIQSDSIHNTCKEGGN